jgi:hypothetical protein
VRLVKKTIDWQSSYRLIPSRFPPVELYEPIASEDDWEALKRVEALTNPRLHNADSMLLPEDQGKIDQNWLVAPFAYPNSESSLYSDGSYGVCVVTEDLHSSLILAIKGREEFLSRTCEGSTRLIMRVIKVPVKARLTDLRQYRYDDPAVKSIIKEQRDANAHGVLLKGPKDNCGFAVILRPTAFVEPAVQAEHYCFIWNGERIHQLYAMPSETAVMKPEDLLGSKSAA